MNADSVKHKETTDIILKGFFEVYNEPGDGFQNLYLIIREKISAITRLQCSRLQVGRVSANLWLSSAKTLTKKEGYYEKAS